MAPSNPTSLLIERSGPVDASVVLPGSKSITNRALLCAALAAGTSTLRGGLVADDTEAMLDGIGALGATVEVRGDTWVVTGRPAGHPDQERTGTRHVDARQSGTTSRFLLPALALDGGSTVVDGHAQLRARPMGPALEALSSLGVRVRALGAAGHLPVELRGPMQGGQVDIGGDVSSQFLSGLLLAGPACPEGLDVRLRTALVSRPYVDMTVAVMRAFEATVTEGPGPAFTVPGTGYRPTDYAIEPDASAASYAWAAAAITGGAVTVRGLGMNALQGDVAFADVLEEMGARVDRTPDAITVRGGTELRGIDVDMEPISDTVMTLAVVAAVASGPTTIRGVDFIRNKESDRIAGPVAELRRAGVDAEETSDGMVIRPGPVHPATIQTYDDHRMAMSFALLGLVRDGIEIADPGCVAKTFPTYWDFLDDLRAHRFPPSDEV